MTRSRVDTPVPTELFVRFSFLALVDPQMKQSVLMLNIDVSIRRSLVGPTVSGMSIHALTEVPDEV